MRRNMQEVLERWGRWAASEEYCSLVDWPAMSVTPGRKPEVGKPGCSDEDGLAIDTCVAHMSTVRDREDILIMGQKFIGGHSTSFIAQSMSLDRNAVRRSLRASEEFLAGCFVAMSIRLDMDLEVALPEKLAGHQKPVLIF
ncbi:antiterminator Q family protein [Mixta mediterraneensis]|uniref:antiterminator Q family protein n=1 Tax=Mixta mediterraneensis TaxID=2758443 RepID=UPI001875A961|nr:antiterminator Q family protein [Mixta mediterraneensis]MBE5253397.1 antitermination protein Q [Mixta mediterraneensis]